ncbi:MAG: DUF4878 domain-containing protein [Thermoleophilia bacterium]
MKFREILKVLVAVVVLSAIVFAAFGCGDSGPTAAVKAFFEASKDKDCEKAVDLLDLSALEEMMGAAGMNTEDVKKQMVDECNASSDEEEIVDYKIIEEKLEGDDKASVEVEVTTKMGDEESTDKTTFQMVKKDGDWKIDIASSAGL